MTTYYVTKVRKHAASAHDHIVGVVTREGVFFENSSVVASIKGGSEWFTEVPGHPHARITPMDYCPAAACYHKPYITTEADRTAKNNLENLPPG